VFGEKGFFFKEVHAHRVQKAQEDTALT